MEEVPSQYETRLILHLIRLVVGVGLGSLTRSLSQHLGGKWAYGNCTKESLYHS